MNKWTGPEGVAETDKALTVNTRTETKSFGETMLGRQLGAAIIFVSMGLLLCLLAFAVKIARSIP